MMKLIVGCSTNLSFLSDALVTQKTCNILLCFCLKVDLSQVPVIHE